MTLLQIFFQPRLLVSIICSIDRPIFVLEKQNNRTPLARISTIKQAHRFYDGDATPARRGAMPR